MGKWIHVIIIFIHPSKQIQVLAMKLTPCSNNSAGRVKMISRNIALVATSIIAAHTDRDGQAVTALIRSHRSNKYKAYHLPIGIGNGCRPATTKFDNPPYGGFQNWGGLVSRPTYYIILISGTSSKNIP